MKRDGHQHAVPGGVEELRAVAIPDRHLAAADRDLPLRALPRAAARRPPSAPTRPTRRRSSGRPERSRNAPRRTGGRRSASTGSPGSESDRTTRAKLPSRGCSREGGGRRAQVGSKLVLLRTDQDLLGASARRAFEEIVEAVAVGHVDEPLRRPGTMRGRTRRVRSDVIRTPVPREASRTQTSRFCPCDGSRLATRHLPAVRRDPDVLRIPPVSPRVPTSRPLRSTQTSLRRRSHARYAIRSPGGGEPQKAVLAPQVDVLERGRGLADELQAPRIEPPREDRVVAPEKEVARLREHGIRVRREEAAGVLRIERREDDRGLLDVDVARQIDEVPPVGKKGGIEWATSPADTSSDRDRSRRASRGGDREEAARRTPSRRGSCPRDSRRRRRPPRSRRPSGPDRRRGPLASASLPRSRRSRGRRATRTRPGRPRCPAAAAGRGCPASGHRQRVLSALVPE